MPWCSHSGLWGEQAVQDGVLTLPRMVCSFGCSAVGTKNSPPAEPAFAPGHHRSVGAWPNTPTQSPASFTHPHTHSHKPSNPALPLVPCATRAPPPLPPTPGSHVFQGTRGEVISICRPHTPPWCEPPTPPRHACCTHLRARHATVRARPPCMPQTRPCVCVLGVCVCVEVCMCACFVGLVGPVSRGHVAPCDHGSCACVQWRCFCGAPQLPPPPIPPCAPLLHTPRTCTLPPL